MIKEKKIRYGILSTASIVPRFIRGMRLTDNGIICSIASRSLEKARAAAEEYDIPAFTDDYHSILEDGRIDAVYIPTINSLHFKMAEESLNAGKHVLVEKPFVLHAEEARKLADLARRKNLFLTEAVKAPHLPVYPKIREIIGSGKYGRICFMDFRQSYTDGPYVTGWNKEKKYGGGVLFGNEAYFFTMAEYLAGRALSCTGTLSFGSHDVEDQCCLSLLLPDGVIASLFVSTNVLFRNGLTIYLQNGRIEIPDYWKASEAYIYQGETLADTLRFPVQYELSYELQHYNECILNGLNFSPVTPVENTARYIAYCEEIKKQAETIPAE